MTQDRSSFGRRRLPSSRTTPVTARRQEMSNNAQQMELAIPEREADELDLDELIEPQIAQASARPAISPVQLAAGFGVIALIAAALLPTVGSGPITRLAELVTAPGIDPIITAGVKKDGDVKRYTVRRSVTQPNSIATPCIIHEDGRREGGC